MLDLVRIQTVCKGYQRTTLVGKALDFGLQADLRLFCWFSYALCGSREGGDPDPPLKKSQKYRDS